jgi:DNA-binding transcriptional LysR family regulator
MVVADELRAGRLREITVAGLELEVWVSVLWRPSTSLSAVARQFIDHLRAATESLQPA